MKRLNARALPLLPMALLAGATALAQSPAPEASAKSRQIEVVEERRQAEESAAVEAYARALEAANAEQEAALEAVRAAQHALSRRAEEQREMAEEMLRLEGENNREEREALARERRRTAEERQRLQREELSRVQGELERAHENMARASREVARVHREIQRPVASVAPNVRFGGNRAVIGVILDVGSEDGVRVLGLSPDGPAERAGLLQGDVIVELLGESLVADGVDGRELLAEAMEAVVPGDELPIAVDRDGERLEYTIVAQERTPRSWHSVTRLATVPPAPAGPEAPNAPFAPVIVQSIQVPRIDRERLEEELHELRDEMEGRQIRVETLTSSSGDDAIYEFESLSDMSGAALAGTNMWFGMPLTRGLKLTEIEAGLGAYFDTDQGVLVLQAEMDNTLKLETGDVILRVNGTDVSRPADVMRALRNVESGAEIDIDIKRRKQDETLRVDVPENRVGALDEFRWIIGDGQSWSFNLVDPDED